MSLSPQSPFTSSSVFAEEDKPVFHAPWEAHVFAIVHQLAENQHYSWAEWTAQLANVIGESEQQAPGEQNYYALWVHACEKLLESKGLLDAEDIEQKIGEILTKREEEHQH